MTDDLSSRLARAEIELREKTLQLDQLKQRATEIETTARKLASQVTEYCRIIRGGNMDHLNTKP